jgi:hypothetical protein
MYATSMWDEWIWICEVLFQNVLVLLIVKWWLVRWHNHLSHQDRIPSLDYSSTTSLQLLLQLPSRCFIPLRNLPPMPTPTNLNKLTSMNYWTHGKMCRRFTIHETNTPGACACTRVQHKTTPILKTNFQHQFSTRNANCQNYQLSMTLQGITKHASKTTESMRVQGISNRFHISVPSSLSPLSVALCTCIHLSTYFLH